MSGKPIRKLPRSNSLQQLKQSDARDENRGHFLLAVIKPYWSDFRPYQAGRNQGDIDGPLIIPSGRTATP